MYRKLEFIKSEAEKGNKIAQEYDNKLEQNRVTFDWAYRIVKEDVKVRRFLKISQIARKQGIEINHDNFVDFIARLMTDKGLKNVDELDSYINTEFR